MYFFNLLHDFSTIALLQTQHAERVKFGCLIISPVMGWSWDKWSSVDLNSELKSVTLAGMIVMLKSCAENLGCHMVNAQIETYHFAIVQPWLCIFALQKVLEQQGDVNLEKEE